MKRPLLVLALLGWGSNSAFSLSARPADIEIALSPTPQQDAIVRVLAHQAQARGWRCDEPQLDVPIAQRRVLLACDDGANDGAVTAFHPVYERGPQSVGVQGYRSATRPDEVEELLRAFLDAVSSGAGTKAVEVNWNARKR